MNVTQACVTHLPVFSRMSSLSSLSHSHCISQGYLIALFLILNVLRFVLVFSLYPLLSRIGLGTNWREAVFMSYSGLRGTVGIALSLALHLDVGKLHI